MYEYNHVSALPLALKMYKYINKNCFFNYLTFLLEFI